MYHIVHCTLISTPVKSLLYNVTPLISEFIMGCAAFYVKVFSSIGFYKSLGGSQRLTIFGTSDIHLAATQATLCFSQR